MIEFEELGIVRRYSGNPVLSAGDMPYSSSLVFNAGVTKFLGKYVMCFRNDYGYRDKAAFQAEEHPCFNTNIGLAVSNDGFHWNVEKEPVFNLKGNGILCAYDPRLTVIDGRCYMCFAANTEWGICGGIAETEDMHHFNVLYLSEPDNRNMVLFPEKINGKFVRLDRPMPVYARPNPEFFDLWLSDSPDLQYWGGHKCLLTHELISAYCNSKTGPAAPPVKTDKGWLATFHAVWKSEIRDLDGWETWGWNKQYMAGVMLLDLEDPRKVLGIAKKPLLVGKTLEERSGFRGMTIFPGGMIKEDSGEVKIYYGAADTVECVGITSVDELIKACLGK